MRKYKFSFIIIISLCASSCKNHKAELNQLQKLTDKLHGEIDENMLKRAEKTRDSLRRIHPEWTNDSSFYNSIMYDTIMYYGTDEMQSLVKHYLTIKRSKDSLEAALF